MQQSQEELHQQEEPVGVCRVRALEYDSGVSGNT